MPDQKGLCLQEWKDAKAHFESKTSKKKPSDKFLGIFRLGNSLEATLKKMDETYTAGVKQTDPAAALKQWKAYLKLVDSFDVARRSYKVNLQKAAAAEAEANALTLELSVLSKTTSAIEAGARINAISQIQVVEKKLSNDPKPQGKEAKARDLMIDTAKKTVPALNSAIKYGALFTVQVKADPTPTTFNDGIQSAARKINQSIANIPKIFDATGDDMGVDTKKAAVIANIMDAWGKGSRKLKPTADKVAVLRELGAYEQMLKASKVLLKELEAAGR